ncbi:unnamed protein product [Linum trigynum]|uniref:Copper ion binding protein n=1 Tax=Linum trigynum TaxID=586398 RepID=A0AAV2D5Z6_9ROSI
MYLADVGIMAFRSSAMRFISRRFSSGGKVLGEEEKAAENVYIKKKEQEKLEKLARKGPSPGEKAGASSAATDATASASTSSAAGGGSTQKVSTDTYRNYAVVAGVVTIAASIGWYLKSGDSQKQEVQE